MAAPIILVRPILTKMYSISVIFSYLLQFAFIGDYGLCYLGLETLKCIDRAAKVILKIIGLGGGIKNQLCNKTALTIVYKSISMISRCVLAILIIQICSTQYSLDYQKIENIGIYSYCNIYIYTRYNLNQLFIQLQWHCKN